MKKVIFSFVMLAILGFSSVYAQLCNNADFSTGNFINWTGSTGSNDTGNYRNIVLGIVAGTPNSLPSDTGQQTIMNMPGTDPNTQGVLSVLPHGGGSCCRLGNDLCVGCNASQKTAARLEYKINVTGSNCIFTYQYAVVLQDPSSIGHTQAECPKFKIYILDSTGTQVGGDCGIYEVTSFPGLPCYTSCPPDTGACDNTCNVIWKEWTTVSVDLSSYIGQTITAQFTSYDCSLSMHFGYAYISCYCGSLRCMQHCLGTSDTLSAPNGFAAYSWTIPPSTTVLGINKNLIINTPVYGTIYKCICSAVNSCDYTVYDTVNCPTFIAEIDTKDNIIISPNPATDNLTIQAPPPATIEITNVEGQVIEQQTTNVGTTNFVVSLLAKGMYFVKVKTEKGVAVKKFIKE